MTAPHLPDDRHPAPVADPEARERVVETLTRLFAEDRITEAELETRLERVYHATSGKELQAVTADLPAPAAEATAVEPAGAAGQRISALLSGVERQWTSVVPRQLQVRGRLGYVELDLTGATFEPGVTVIDARAFMGYVQIRLPFGVRVECLGRAFAGFFSLKGATREDATDEARVVRIVGRASFGFVEGSVAPVDRPRIGGRSE